MFLPDDMVQQCVGSPVTVILTGGTELDGVLAAADGSGGLVLQDATSYHCPAPDASNAPLAPPMGLPGVSPPPQGGPTTAAVQLPRTELAKYRTVLVNSHNVRIIIPGGLPAV